MSVVLEVATLIGVLVAAVGVVVAADQLHELRKQQMREFESLFVQRFWKIMDDLSLEALEGSMTVRGVVSPTDRKAVIAFL